MSLAVTTKDGIKLRNCLLVGSGPPSASFSAIDRARRAGFAGAVIKTVSPDSEPIQNVAPRYGRIHSKAGEVIGHQNIELIATEPVAHWLDTVKRIKDVDPEFVIICSMMAPCDKPDEWRKLIEEFEAAGVDGFEGNKSCPHGFANRGMGAAIGEHPELVEQTAGFMRSATKRPVWSKLTPNVMAHEPARAALRGGASGISAINTVRCIIDVNLDTMAPVPTVSGTKLSTTGGYSHRAVLPIALARVNDIAKVIHGEFGGNATLSGIGGITDWESAVKHLLLGAETVQICTAIMLDGFGIAGPILEGIEKFMEQKGFRTMAEMSGFLRDSIVSFDEIQAQYAGGKGVVRDSDWSSGNFVGQVKELT